MATRNRTILCRKCRDALKSVRVPSSSSPSSSSGGPVIELSTASLLNPNRSYAPLSTEDPGGYSGCSETIVAASSAGGGDLLVLLTRYLSFSLKRSGFKQIKHVIWKGQLESTCKLLRPDYLGHAPLLDCGFITSSVAFITSSVLHNKFGQHINAIAWCHMVYLHDKSPLPPWARIPMRAMG
ncbi:syntaxin of plants 41 [Actinidia rufa]|uniref:Syntaxin of plants 41 n=1 Tax=Actinidia rufa TaxID=165716 RepID=A0A7J0EY48_9ERIC|nr:syntaxin of plants 41 [Actinidia rufa]